VGESLSGAIREPLTGLGMWDGFLRSGAVPGYEIRAAWGDAEPTPLSSVFRPHGAMWHVDRARFDADLRDQARRRGCTLRHYQRLGDIRRAGGTWQLDVDGETLEARFLIDATGRCRALSRRLGARARCDDRLVAMVTRVPRNHDASFAHAMVVEATPYGWWYASPVPGGHVLAVLTDADLLREARPHLQPLRPVSAGSAVLDTTGQNAWLATGDAAASHDPLCGFGVHRALSNGMRAGDAVAEHLRTGRIAPLDAYRAHCREQYERYLDGLREHYSAEGRWPEAPFWARRRRVLAHV
jgi:flavin-dependent dehydrogenase